jgi:signal transduction histidine kinase
MEFTTEVLHCCKEGVLILNDKHIVQTANQAAIDGLGAKDSDAIMGKHIKEVSENYPEQVGLLLALEAGIDASADDFSVTVKGVRESLLYIICIRPSHSFERSETYHRALEKSNKELDEFAHIVSHDLKAPLRAISNLSLWLQEDLGDSLTGDNRDNFSKLRNRVVRMEALINGILEYSRIGRQSVRSESIDVFLLVQEIVEILGPPANVKIHIQPDLPTLHGPKLLLIQVFSNLISNAIKYNDKADGMIRISAETKDGYYQFMIEDNGPGIPAEYHEKIFMIFQTLQSRDKIESSGIGLTIVKKILTTVGGKIWLTSEPARGTAFLFTWPDKCELNVADKA